MRHRPTLAVLRLEDRRTPANIVWTGTRPDGLGTDWFGPTNWEVVGSNPVINRVPGPGDDVTVPNGPPVIAVNGAASVRSLFFDRGNGLDINGSLALGAGGSWTAFRLNGSSTLSIGDGATVGEGFYPCSVTGTGSITNPAGRTITVINAGWAVPYTNQGITAAHSLTLAGPITAAPGSVFRVIGIAATGPGRLNTESFTNQGTVELTSIGGAASATLFVRNGATFTHAAGALIAARVGAGNSQRRIVPDTGASIVTAGDWLVEPGVTLDVGVSVGFTWQGGNVSGGGILDLPNTIIPVGATLDAPADATLALSGNNLSGTGTFRVLPGRTQSFVNSTVSAAYVNQGTTVLTSSNLTGAVTNAAGATLRLIEAFGNSGNMSTSAFTNAGRIELASTGRAWTVTSGTGTLVNGPTGVIDITGADHTINALGGGGFVNQGTMNVPVNAGLNVIGTASNAGQITLSNGATLGGTAALANAVGGLLAGTGTFERAVTNAGTVRPGLNGPGFLGTLNYTQTATGSFAVDLFGPTAGTDHDQLRTPDFTTVTLAGALVINPASTPAAGTVFRIIDNGGRVPVVGTFDGLPQNGTVTVAGTTYRISYTAGDGNDVTLTVVAPAAAPRVSGVAVNAGQANTVQRSRVTSLAVTFSTQVAFAGPVAAAFIVSRVNGGPLGGFTATASVVNGVTVVTLSGFTGAETDFGSLADGRYTLTVLSSQVSANGQQLDAFTLTGSTANGLFRLFGDANGDGSISGGDFGVFRLAFGTTTGQAGYVDWLDFDGNGSISGGDFGNFRVRFGTTVP